MPTVNTKKPPRIYLYPERDLYQLLEKHAKSHCVSMNEYCLNLITRGLLAEDVETIRSDLEGVVSKITEAGGLKRSELLVILEILGYMRIMFAENQPSNVERAKGFAEKAVMQLLGEE